MLRLRAYQSSDAERIAAWLEDERQLFLWSAGRMQWPLTKEQFQNFAAEQLQQPRTMLITAIDEFNEPVGFLCMTKADYQQKRIHVCFIVVTNQSRGKGYGTQMLQQAIGLCRRFIADGAHHFAGCLPKILLRGSVIKNSALWMKPVIRQPCSGRAEIGRLMIWCG